MKLGAFSISLNVKDLTISKEFYEKLGFSVFGGDPSYKYLILKNEFCVIGLFEGMFEKNILTFNPGWDQNAATIPHFEDVREIQQKLINQELILDRMADKNTKGPASIVLTDPDGNTILIDQHV